MDSFIKATKHSVKSKRMGDRDFANRFVAFFIGYSEYSGELDAFLNDKMGELNRMNPEQREFIRQAFDKSMVCCYQIFNDDSFRRRLNEKDPRKPISKAVYDTLSVNIAWLTDEERCKLIANANIFKERMMELFNDRSFNSAITTGTGKKYSVDLRFVRVKELIRKIIES